jgi:signal peptidase II
MQNGKPQNHLISDLSDLKCWQIFTVAWPWGVLFMLGAFGLDRGVKHLMLEHPGLGHVAPAIPGLVQWHVVNNTGLAWSMLEQHPLLIKWWVTALWGVLLVLASRSKNAVFWLVAGAAASNVFDRWVYGAVIDFIDLQFIHYPVFNVADAIIVSGAVILAFRQLQQMLYSAR